MRLSVEFTADCRNIVVNKFLDRYDSTLASSGLDIMDIETWDEKQYHIEGINGKYTTQQVSTDGQYAEIYSSENILNQKS